MRCTATQFRLESLCAIVGLLLALTASLSLAQRPRFSRPTPVESGFTEAAPPSMKDISVIEHRGDAVPLDLPFVDEHGQPVTLGKYFSGNKPVILQLGYYSCPMLCSLVAQGTAKTLADLTLTPGKDYEYVFVSIDPKEKPKLAAEKKQSYLGQFTRNGGEEGFHFLTGQQADIHRLADAIGFRYRWVESAQQFAHPAVITLLTPDGHISRYLYGVKFDNKTTRLSLVEASNNKIGSFSDHLFLTCFHYDGTSGKYSLAAISAMKVGGAVTLLVLAFVLTLAFRHERARAAMLEAQHQEQQATAGENSDSTDK